MFLAVFPYSPGFAGRTHQELAILLSTLLAALGTTLLATFSALIQFALV